MKLIFLIKIYDKL